MADGQKIQSTYRSGARTPEYIIEAINEGIEKNGSFPKFVDALVEEHLAAKGEGSDAANAVAQPVDTSALEKKLDGHVDELRKMYEEILTGLQGIGSTTENNVNIELPDNLATTTDLRNVECAIKNYIDKSVTHTVDAVVSQIDTIITTLMSKLAELEMPASGEVEAPVIAVEEDVEQEEAVAETVVEDKEASEDDAVNSEVLEDSGAFTFADDTEAEKVALGLSALMETTTSEDSKSEADAMNPAELTIPSRRDHMPTDVSDALTAFADEVNELNKTSADNLTDGILDDNFFADDDAQDEQAENDSTESDDVDDNTNDTAPTENAIDDDIQSDDFFAAALESDPNVVAGFKSLFG